MYLSKLSVQISSWGARHSAHLLVKWQEMASLCIATKQLAVEQQEDRDSKLILVITVDELRDHLGALDGKSILIVCHKVH